MTAGPTPDDGDLVPVSVRLGNVVPPDDPEDWTRPLTWVAALGMLAAPAVALTWYLLAAPIESTQPLPGTWAVAIALVVGAGAAGATQIGRLRAFAGTVAAALLGALLVVLVGAITAGEVHCCESTMVSSASPTLAHAAAVALAGLAGAVPASVAAGLVAGRLSRPQRGALAGLVGALVTAIVLPNLFPAEPHVVGGLLVTAAVLPRLF